MHETALQFLPAKELTERLRKREIKARDLLELYLARVQEFNPALNAVIWTDADGARARADAADRRLDEGRPMGVLDGLPMTVKESFQIAGSPTTFGSIDFKDNIDDANADVVERVNAAGANIFGKTNVPLNLADWQSFNAVYGTTNNPWDVSKVPGGSSGGAAAALAAGMTGLEIGSDIGASIRNPSHYCGVYGHKPTYGVVSYFRHALPGVLTTSDITVAGPLARSADDLELALDVIAGPEKIEAAGWRLELPASNKQAIKDFRVAVMLTDPCSEVDQAVQDEIGKVAEFLASRGADVSYTARPDFSTAEAFETYIALLRAATSGRQTDEIFAQNQAIAAGFDPADKSYYAQMTRANVMSHRDWLAVHERRTRLRHEWARFYGDWDVMIMPAAASAAFPHDQEGERHNRKIDVNGKRVPTTDQLFWAGIGGGYYLPGTVAPAGLTPGGLPVGVQIVGPQFGDRTTIQLARLLEREYRSFQAPPGY